MIRGTNDYDLLDKFTIDFCEIVEKYSKYIIISGFFAISCGRARATEDIDMFIERMSIEKFRELHKDLTKKFICIQGESADEVYEYLEEGASIRYTYLDRDIPEMEVKFVKDELERDQLMNRQKFKEITGLDIYFGPLNAQIAFKEEYLKSDKDLEDARHLRSVFRDEISENEIAYYKKKIREVKL